MEDEEAKVHEGPKEKLAQGRKERAQCAAAAMLCQQSSSRPVSRPRFS